MSSTGREMRGSCATSQSRRPSTQRDETSGSSHMRTDAIMAMYSLFSSSSSSFSSSLPAPMPPSMPPSRICHSRTVTRFVLLSSSSSSLSSPLSSPSSPSPPSSPPLSPPSSSCSPSAGRDMPCTTSSSSLSSPLPRASSLLHGPSSSSSSHPGSLDLNIYDPAKSLCSPLRLDNETTPQLEQHRWSFEWSILAEGYGATKQEVPSCSRQLSGNCLWPISSCSCTASQILKVQGFFSTTFVVEWAGMFNHALGAWLVKFKLVGETSLIITD